MADWDLVLLRHGIAEPHGAREDRLRALTPEGRQRTRQICQRACQVGLQAPTLISSPLTRARQTGEIAMEAGLASLFRCDGALAPGADPLPLLQGWLGQGPTGSPTRLILVGHEPDLGLLACRLIGAPAGAVALKKAGIAVVSWPQTIPTPSLEGCAQLRLLLTPRVLIGAG
ncbi:MAG: SixA phosphatase family protein [Cyanobacteriota bacterium]|jgi:phosphohistidine phosphatase